MNILAYTIYLLITWMITVHAGASFYRNGRNYLLNMLKGDERLTDHVNRLLLTGYYTINLGYATMMISFWKIVEDWNGLVESISVKCGQIMILLACMHYFNMAAIYMYHRLKRNSQLKIHH
jgi:hypothetical protein